jgi:hypothetical protein
MHTWTKLLELTRGKKFNVKKVYVPEEEITIEGDFQVSDMAMLDANDQRFIVAFIKTHGSIKQMESIFNISYPTVKNKLNELSRKLDSFSLQIDQVDDDDSLSDLLDKIASGELAVKDALKELNK